MELAGNGCWDCPIPFGEVAVRYAVLAVLIAISAALMAARRQLYRGLGWMATVALFFWALMYTVVIPRWGIGASDVPLEIWSRRASWLILGAMNLALVLVAVTIFRWRSGRYTRGRRNDLTRPGVLFMTALMTLSIFGGEEVPSSNVVGGLRRAPLFGASLNAAQDKPTIEAVGPSTPAAKMGLQQGDVILSVDGTAVDSVAAFVAAIAKKRAGDPVTIAVRRGDATLTKQEKLAAKPIESQADYGIEYGHVDAGGTKRRVIVTRPTAAGKYPAVLLIGGIGCYSLDGILRPAELHDAYARVLDAFTRAGYVTMRVEKSGMGDSEGPPCMDPRSDFEAEVRGFAAGLAQLESLDFVDKRNVFLFAHSIGPLVAARIASEHPVRGIVVAETIGTSWIEYDLTNVRRQLLLSGAPYDEVDRRLRHHQVCAHRFYVEKQTPEQITASDSTCARDLQGPAPYTYMQQLGALDLAPLWKKIDAQVLIFYGTADFITDDYQHQYLRNMINAFHPGHATYIAVDGMDHGLLLTGTQKASFEGVDSAPFAQRVVDDTLQFFKRAQSGRPG